MAVAPKFKMYTVYQADFEFQVPLEATQPDALEIRDKVLLGSARRNVKRKVYTPDPDEAKAVFDRTRESCGAFIQRGLLSAMAIGTCCYIQADHVDRLNGKTTILGYPLFSAGEGFDVRGNAGKRGVV